MKEQVYPLALVDEIQQRLELLREKLSGYTKLEADVQENSIRQCILQLMDMDVADHRGRMRKLFFQVSHWQAVYRILVDYKLGAVDGDYIGFSSWMQRIIPADCRVPFNYEAFRSISRTPFGVRSSSGITTVPISRPVCLTKIWSVWPRHFCYF